jgi:hypothetical protein
MSNTPDPKDCRTLEEYRWRLELHDEFVNKVEAVNEIMKSTKSEEEFDAAMAKLGYEKHDDAPCGRLWCEERYGCVWVNLEFAQQNFEKYLFEPTFRPEDRILSEEDTYQCCDHGCRALPETWFKKGRKEYEVFRWFLELIDTIEWNSQHLRFDDLASEAVTAAFLREAYFWTLSVLREKLWENQKEGAWLIEEFLKENALIKPEDSHILLEAFKQHRKGGVAK